MGDRFPFGENWESFLQNVTDEHVGHARNEIRGTFQVEALEGNSFLDVGCGSGIFSLAAYQLGAERILSFDFDDDAVACGEKLRDSVQADNWSITRGDVLDAPFIRSLGTFDYVYCWGVVHHTGDMWNAIDNVTAPVSGGGQLCLGIYNRVDESDGIYHSGRALQLKRLFTALPEPLKRLMVVGYGGAHLTLRTILKRQSPIRYLNSYGDTNRGMDYWHDVRDWLGGLPFEYASPEEVHTYFERHHEDFQRKNTIIRGTRPESVNVYLYERDGTGRYTR